MFENDICVDLPDVLGGEPDCANSLFPRFFSKARCPSVLVPSGIIAVEVANSPILGFFARARFPLVLAPSGVAAVEV